MAEEGSGLDVSARDLRLEQAFYGPIIHSVTPTEVQICHKGLLLVGPDGKIALFRESVEKAQVAALIAEYGTGAGSLRIRYLERGQFLIPGFVDTHNHAPQWAQRGTGRGLLLLDWLNEITFPHEAKFADPAYARKTYSSCVDGFLRQGITTASYYGSLHGEATKILADLCLEKGQRALIGKCNMNQNAPAECCDASAKESLEVTKDFIAHVDKIDPEHKVVTPTLAPRFAISCDRELLTGLGEIAKANPNIPIQTHFNEAEDEIQFTKTLFHEFSNEADLYANYGLLNSRSILAHCIFLEDYEVDKIAELGCGIAHCPISNTTIGGFMAAPIRQYLRREINVGLGTDSGGGFSSSILDAMRQAFIVSKAREVATEGADPALSLSETFYLATLGGAKVCGLGDKIGNFAEGKEFDALEIHTLGANAGIITPIEDEDDMPTVFEKFLMTGDDRNIAKVYVRGRSVKA
ncbi:putative guanine deaminase [Lasiodiplodia hormozganensis]|uniref:Probable guanine deaminase n=1 Tax=Lasiodiplodia hormozganensis TaxID=869390 RepID=A0AA39YCI9_9PEZI|nr:putative guanine deaminase [Lasiodiplodia hormozganensis]